MTDRCWPINTRQTVSAFTSPTERITGCLPDDQSKGARRCSSRRTFVARTNCGGQREAGARWCGVSSATERKWSTAWASLCNMGELPFDERERVLLRVSTRCDAITSPVRVFHRQATAVRSVHGLDSVFGVSVLHRLAGWRNAILSARIRLGQDRFCLRRRIVAACRPLLRRERISSALHPLLVRFVAHRTGSTQQLPNRCTTPKHRDHRLPSAA